MSRKRDIDKVPAGGIEVKRAIVVSPARNGRKRGVLAQDLLHFRSRLRGQAPLRDLGDNRMPLRPPRVRLREQGELDETGKDKLSHQRPQPLAAPRWRRQNACSSFRHASLKSRSGSTCLSIQFVRISCKVMFGAR